MSFPAAIDLRRGRKQRASNRKRAAAASATRKTGAGASWRFKLLLVLVISALVAAAAFLLVRDSSLVAVEEVRVSGLSGHYDKDAREAVIRAASEMTTLNFDKSRIEEAAAEFVDVASVEVSTDFPHAATIRVHTRRPVVNARIAGRSVTLSQHGEIFTPTHAVASLPAIDVPGTIQGNRVVSGKAHEAVQVLGAAPDIMLRKVSRIHWGKLGIVVSLKGGADLYFGDAQNARTKWKDAAAVLANEKSSGAAYLDLRVPGRVSVGGIGGAPVAATSITPASPEAAGGAAPQPEAQGQAAPQQQAAPQAPAQQAPATPTPAPQAGGAPATGAAPAQ